MDPASAMLLFVLFQAAEKAVGYAGGKIADSMTKPISEALEERAKWLAGKDETAKRWQAFLQAFTETGTKLKTQGRHPKLAGKVVEILAQFDLKTLPDNQWLDELAIQLEKTSLVTEKPDEFLLIELFSHVLPAPISRAELSETISDFITIFQDALFAQTAYQESMFKRAQWQILRQPIYDTRERYIEQIIEHYENLDFVGIPELKDRQALQIEDVFISLQTQVEESDHKRIQGIPEDLREESNTRTHQGYLKPKITRRLSINQALTESQKIVVLGDPGSGKTTLLKYILIALAENKGYKIGLIENRLPIFIRLYDYVAKREECDKDGFSFTDYLNKYCTDHLQLHLPPDFFEQALERGNCCVCFDGLDELGAAGIRREITLAVSALANRYHRNRFIVTSRIVGYEEAPLNRKDFTHHTVQPLNDEDIKLFVEKWYKARERDAAIRRERTEHLVKTIMGEERIKLLAANPLMLTIIALVHRIEAELPHERVKLYDKCVTTLMETWDKGRGMKTTLRRRLLEKLAYWMHSQPGEKGRTHEVREGTLRLQLAHFLQSDPKNNMDEDQIQKEVENFITLVKTRSGLLVERGEDVYTFSHLTFQEYLTACDIEKKLAHSTEALWIEIQPKLHDAHWREVIMLLLGSLNRFEAHNSILVGKIYDSSDIYDSVLHRHLFLSAQALSDRVEVDSALHNQIVDDLLKLASSDAYAKFDAFKSLGGLQNDLRAGSGLLGIARDEKVDGFVRFTAAEALGQLGRVDEVVLKGLLGIAGDEKVDADLRRAAAQSLGQLGWADEAGMLLLALAGDEKVDVLVRRNVAQALGQLGHADEAGMMLLGIARDEKVDAYVRSTAAEALGQLGRVDEAGVLLLRIAENEKEGTKSRRAAAQGLGQLERVDEATLKGLLGVAVDENVDVELRGFAAQALGQLGRADEAVLRGLLGMARDEKVYAFVRSEAAHALGQMGWANETVLKELLGIAGDEKVHAFVRSAAAQALGQLGGVDEVGLKGLLGIAGDEKEDADVRSAAAQALGQLGGVDEVVLKGLLGIAGDEKVDADVRRTAAQSLGQLGRVDEAGLLLLRIAGGEKVDAYVRYSAAEALGQLRGVDEVVLKGLLGIAGDEKVDADVRCAAAQSLGQLGRADEAGVLLLALAGDEKVYDFVRRAAAEGLGQLGNVDEVVLEGLLGITGDEKVDAYVRSEAMQALKQLLG